MGQDPSDFPKLDLHPLELGRISHMLLYMWEGLIEPKARQDNKEA